MQLPDLSFLWVIFFVLLLTFLLNRLLFQPLFRVMDARASSAKTARAMADTAAAKARQATAEFEAKTRAARQDIARQLDEARRRAEGERVTLVAAAHEQARGTIADASAQIASEAAVAKERIGRESTDLAHVIADRVLGRQTT